MRKSKGFSLLEVLVAFVFLALVAATLFRVFSGALRNVSTAEDYTRAVLVAETRLASLGIETPVKEGSESGDIEGDKFRWTVNVRPYVSPESADGAAAGVQDLLGARLMEVEVVVDWPATGDQRRQVALDSIRFVPVK
jgi:general secretion pathway protein I